MIIDDFDIHMISISDNEFSQQLREVCQASWEHDGWEVNHFEAITPDTMDRCPIELTFGLKTETRRIKHNAPFLETEKAIWASHVSLWYKCWQQQKPYVILEHDCKLLTAFPKVWDLAALKYFCKAGQPDRTSKMLGKTSPKDVKFTPAAGYIILPDQADSMLHECVTSDIYLPVDGVINQYRDAYSQLWAQQYATQHIIWDKDSPTGIKSTIAHE